MLEFVMLKSCKTFDQNLKLYSNLFLTPTGRSLFMEAEKDQKPTKFFKKLEKSKFYQKLFKFVTLIS